MKRSALDKAIAKLEAKRVSIDMAIDELKSEQTAKPTRKPRLVKAAPAQE